MKRISGIADAEIVHSHESKGKQRVVVSDGDGLVVISTSSSSPAGLTPEQARFLAESLVQAAGRVEHEIKERGAQ